MPDEFQVQYQPLLEADSFSAQIGLLPWDMRIFGFPVAELRLDGVPDPGALNQALIDYSCRTGTALVSTQISVDRPHIKGALLCADFKSIDLALTASLTPLRLENLGRKRFSIRKATPADEGSVLEIASSGFVFGRYHMDPLFPDHLARRRYVSWVSKVFRDQRSDNVIHVYGPEGRPMAFINVFTEGPSAFLRLAAAAPGVDFGIAGFAIYVECLRTLATDGLANVTASVSAGNTAVLNLLASLGFRFSRPQWVFHWHSASLPQLNSASAIGESQCP